MNKLGFLYVSVVPSLIQFLIYDGVSLMLGLISELCFV